MKLWLERGATPVAIEKFTAGDDPHWDRWLAKYDCQASLAHVQMLAQMGFLSAAESAALIRELNIIKGEAARGKFAVTYRQEDCHTAIENRLVRKLGEAGKKVHLFRSRNDQVQAALRLLYRDELQACAQLLDEIICAWAEFRQRYGGVPLPGFSHTRKAMPSTVGLWAESFQCGFRDDLLCLRQVQNLVDQSPLGSGAGYGIPYPIDRKVTAEALGFSRLQENALYVQNSRGKFEGAILNALTLTMLEINKLATDLIFFNMPEFGFFDLPDCFFTGSSIMPHKRNPDVLELLRARYHTVLACEFRVKSMAANLLSGYHRDFQETKEPVLRGLSIGQECLRLSVKVVENLRVDEKRCRLGISAEMHSAERAMAMAQHGVPFREAYRAVAAEFSSSRPRKAARRRQTGRNQ